MEQSKLYEEIAQRTEGDIYIGVVGPVRTGKSTFIKRFMETLVIPNIENVYRRERARDELPQSGSGRTIMTAEPKFVPEEAATLELEDGIRFSVRLIDSVGYLVNGAVGQMENDSPRMVMTPWFDHEIPMTEAAEVGTRKVIAEHSTIGIVITTDGTITEIAREDYLEAESRVIQELKRLGKPFLVLVNSQEPESDRAKAIVNDISARYGVSTLAVNCFELQERDISNIIAHVLYEFPLKELDIYLPSWVEALEYEHPIKREIYESVLKNGREIRRIRQVQECLQPLTACDSVSRCEMVKIDLGRGVAEARLEVPRELFYGTLSSQSGFKVSNDGDLIQLLTELSAVKKEYDKVGAAIASVRETGYGIVVPTIEELMLEEPEIMRQGGRYGVKLRASAPSIHMLRADIKTVISPIVGSEKQSEEMIHYLLEEFEGDTKKIWQSNIFGKSFHELVNEDLQAKLSRMPEDARSKLRETLERIVNEGTGGLICIIL
ncbi:MAG: stage IV sporulation protein A [Oscillospiraceae bacterium]|nr:stage IV sporulation protein A [Oscillospiraceae bacterium]